LIVLCLACGRLGFGDTFDAADGSLTNDAGGDGQAADATAPTNDDCATATDVTAGGTFGGTTCGADDTILFTCGVAGTPDVFYSVILSGGTTIDAVVTPGFLVQLRQLDCAGVGNCAPGALMSMGGGTPGTSWYFGIEEGSGACGPFTVTFTVN